MNSNDNKNLKPANKSKGSNGLRYRSDILVSLMQAYGWTRDGIQKEMQRMSDRGEMTDRETITLPTIGKIMRGENVHVDSLISIARFFDIPVMRLFDFEDQLPTVRENNLRREGVEKYKLKQEKKKEKGKSDYSLDHNHNHNPSL